MALLSCLLCEEADRALGVLCASCAEGLVSDELCPEQIRARHLAPAPAGVSAWLIDGFGIPHSIVVDPERPAAAAVTVGRGPGNDVAIAEATVSHAHALLEHRPKSGAWFLLDRGSDNGSFVGDSRVERRYPLERGDRLFFGRRVGFRFLPLDEPDLKRAQAALLWLRSQAPSVQTRSDLVLDEAPPSVVVHAVREGGAVCVVGRERVQLSELEYELLVVLARSREEEREVDDAARGFVPSALLLEQLCWRSEVPTHANLRVLVRKVRRKLATCDPPVDVIESRQGLGYRLAHLVTLG